MYNRVGHESGLLNLKVGLTTVGQHLEKYVFTLGSFASTESTKYIIKIYGKNEISTPCSHRVVAIHDMEVTIHEIQEKMLAI